MLPLYRYRLLDVSKLLGIAVLYALPAKIALDLFSTNGVASIVWPSSGLALAVLLAGGSKYAPGICLGAWLGNMLAGNSPLVSAGIAAGNTLEALCGAWLVTRGGEFDPAMRSLRDFFRLLILAGFIGTAVSAAIGTTTLWASGFLAADAYFPNFAYWYLGDALGITLVTPLLLIWRQAPHDWLTPKRAAEAALLLGMSILAGQVVFLGWFYDTLGSFAKGYLMFLPVAWTAVRLGGHGAVLVLIATAMQALWGAYLGTGFFAGDLATTHLGNFWLYMMTLVVVAMALATYTNELRQAAERLQLASMVFEHSNEAIIVTDGQNRILSANPMFEAITGYSEAEVLGMTPRMCFHSGRQDADFYRTMWQAINQRGRWQGELWNRRKNGDMYPEWLSISTLRNAESHITHHLAIFSDITARKQAEEALQALNEALESKVQARTAELQESQGRLEAIIENLPEIFFMKDTLGRYVALNRYCEAAMGFDRAQIIGCTDWDIFPKPLAEAFTAMDREALNRRAPVNSEDSKPHSDGTLHDYSTTLFPLLDQHGKVYALAGIASDVTRSKQLQREIIAAKEEAERLARLKSEFLANMSHEIRTPLNAVLGLARIGERDSGERAAQETFQRILDSGQHLLGVVNDILDFSKIEAGKLMVETKPFRLAATVDKAVGFVMQRARDKGLALNVFYAAESRRAAEELRLPESRRAAEELRLPESRRVAEELRLLESRRVAEELRLPELPEWVEGDRLRLKQILINLLSNAVKFTERGSVSLTVTRQEQTTVFRVADTGIGLTAEQISRLFTPFEQADGATTRKYGGSGLGLAISRQLAHRMGGDIRVESRPAVGSTFILQLPLPVSSQPRPQAKPPLQGARLAGLRVLAAEDVEVNRFILQDLLAHEGAHAVFAENGQQALDRLQAAGADVFDVVLMDVQMPVMDGREAARCIHAMAPGLPVIGLTAHALAEERELSLASGMADYVTKPVDTDALVAAILNAIASGHKPALHFSREKPEPAPSPQLQVEGSPPDGGGMVDWPALLARFKGRREFVAKLAATMRESQADTPAKLRTAAQDGNTQALSFLSHSLKGLGGNLEAHRLHDLAKRTEAAARAVDADAPVLAGKLAETLETLLAELGRSDFTEGDG